MKGIQEKLQDFSRKILITMVAVFVVLSLLIGVISITGAFKRARIMIQDALISKGMTLVKNNSLALVGMVEDNAFIAVRGLVAETVAGDRDVLYGIFMDAGRQVWTRADSANPDGTVMEVDILADALSAWADSVGKASFTKLPGAGFDVIEFAAPVEGEMGRLGTIRYGFSTASAELTVARTKRTWMTMFAVFAAGYIVIISILYQTVLRMSRQHAADITRPLADLMDAAGAITSGKYNRPVKVISDDEIGRLAVSFETMRKEIHRHTTHLEQMVAERTEALERSNRELTDFAHIASHDLQEPLRKVTAFGDRLQSRAGDTLDERSRDYLARMQNAAFRMSGLLSGLLSYARVTTKGNPFVAVDLDVVTKEVLGDLEIRVSETGGRVDTGKLGTVTADPLQMRQLIQNLVGNALKYHKPDVPPVVKLAGAVTADGKWYELTVADNGIGIADEDKEKAFGIFQRLVGKGEYEGTGVGLSICKKIVERHGGMISLQGEPGVGTVFTVKLPLTGDSPAE